MSRTDRGTVEAGPAVRDDATAAAALRAYACFAILLAIYYAAARIADVPPALGTSLAATLGAETVPDLMFAYIVGRMAWIGMVRTRTFRDFWAVLKADLSSARTAERLVGIPVYVGGAVFAFDVYGAFKQAIPRLTRYAWDQPLAYIDWLIHFRRDPWTLTSWIDPGGWAFRAIDEAYTAWYLAFILTILVFATWAPSRLRARFFITMTAILMLGGTLAALLFASGGPVYFAELTGEAGRFAPLLEYLAGTRAREGQRILWEAFASGSHKLYGGISGMPSMHVAMAVLMALAFHSWSRPAGWLVAAYAVVIQIGSVHLGWHYAIDGYVGAALALSIWLVAGGLLRRMGWPEGAGPGTAVRPSAAPRRNPAETPESYAVPEG